MARRWRLAAHLRPRAGRRLPAQHRLDRVGETARRIADGVRDPAFAHLLSEIDDRAPLHRGNRVTLYFSGYEAFAAMLAAIGGAREEVLLESYIFKDDRAGQEILEALAETVRRGVAVKVLADAFGSLETHEAFWHRLRDAGIELHLFHPLLAKIWAQPLRDHRKILVVDRSVGFTGGMNIGEEYGSSRRCVAGTWRDTHARLEGPAAREMALVFAEGWERAGGTPLHDLVLEEGEPPGTGTADALVLDSRPGRGHAEAASVLAAIVGAARETVWITNAYFAPGRRAVEILGQAAARGVDVRLLLPGMSDAPLVRHAGHGWFRTLLERGVGIWEYEAAVLHAKSLVVDGHAAVVGSTNIDFRSFHFNAECNLVLLDGEVGAALTAAFTADLEAARRIELKSWRQRSVAHRVGNRLARLLSPLL